MSKASKTINLFSGHPTIRLLPRQEILQATNNILFPESDTSNGNNYEELYADGKNRHPLSYGSDEGSYWVRHELAQWLNRTFQPDHSNDSSNSSSKGALTADNINLTGGSSYGVLNALLQCTLAQTNYTKQAFIVTPAYYLINNCFIDAGFGGKITAIDEGPDGDSLNLKYLEEKLAWHEKHSKQSDSELEESLKIINDSDRGGRLWKKVYKYVFWCVPTFSNPGGITLLEKTKLKLIEIARKYDVLIITDDVYDVLDFRNAKVNKTSAGPAVPYKRLVTLDRETLPEDNQWGNTISNASFSKITAPGLRVGWQATATPKLASQLGRGGANLSGGSPSQLNANIAGDLIRTGTLDKIIANFVNVYAERAQAVKDSVERYLPKGTKLQGGNGGYFVWITLPEGQGYDAHLICAKAQERNVKLANGENFEVSGDGRNWGKGSVRVSISLVELEDIEEGFKIWGEVCEEVKNAAK